MNCVLAESSSLSTLFDISNLIINNVTNINGMFARCSSLISVFAFSKIHKTNLLSITIFIYYSYDDSIQHIKNKIKIREDIPPELLIFFLNGQQLEDSKALKYYNIQNKNNMIRINFENFQLIKFYQSIKNKEDTLRL